MCVIFGVYIYVWFYTLYCIGVYILLTYAFFVLCNTLPFLYCIVFTFAFYIYICVCVVLYFVLCCNFFAVLSNILLCVCVYMYNINLVILNKCTVEPNILLYLTRIIKLVETGKM